MDKKSEQLGLNYATAQGRLQRLIIFWLAKKTGLDICYRCNKKIERIEDLSVEHKQAWQDINPTLFWDVENNIAFSHRSCNYRAASRLRHYDKRRLAPVGTAWCSGHKDYLSVTLFGPNRSNPNGLYDYCRDCRKEHGWQGTLADDERVSATRQGRRRKWQRGGVGHGESPAVLKTVAPG